MKGFIDPPSQEDEEWQPENGELNTQIDRTSFCQFRRNLRLAQKVLQAASQEENLSRRVKMDQISVGGRGPAYRRNRPIRSKTDERQKYEAEPSET